ncbi:MAG: DNA polymerase III subunit gamma/tau [Epsilonproteobacteria bacterium]|nr:DNA polymerase III subunit gamma/tau [Campylobacterota bacterium]
MTLALKYRPRRFEDLIGQEAVSQTLARALDSKKLGHAYLFSGLRGSGKTSTARIFAKALLCREGPTSRPCEKCEECQAANEGRHIDIIEMDAASNRKIDDIRDLIEHTKYKPAQGRYKIFIIDEVHMLTNEAFNALLKTLEEPPEFVKFILATTDPLKLPATIISRTQHFRFKRISQTDIVHHLEHILALEGVEYEKEALEILARSGEGSLRDTLTLLEQAITFCNNHIDTPGVARMLGLIDPARIEEIFEAVLGNDRERILSFVQEASEYEAQMIVDEMIQYLKKAVYQKDPRFTLMLQERFFRILSEARHLLFVSGDDEFVLTVTLLKMMEATRIKPIEEVIAELEQESAPLPSGMSSSPKPIPASTPSKPSPKELFTKLIDKLYERNYELGKCFEKSVTFVSFENGVLTWESHPPQECREKLRLSYGTIKHFIKELFGIDTKIKKLDSSRSTPPPPSQQKEEPLASCIGSGFKESATEDILNAPLVQKAKELFGATKINIKHKT